MLRHTPWALFAFSLSALTLACYAPTSHAGGWDLFHPAATDMEKLACHIDKLEKHLDTYGTIVPKTPDVWGEARLTRHRQQVEDQLESQLGAFRFVLNGALSRADSSFLASATIIESLNGTPALSGENGSPPPSIAAVASITPDVNDGNSTIIPRNTTTLLTSVPESATRANGTTTVNIGIEPTIYLDQLNRYLSHLNELRRMNEGDDNTDTPGYALHLVRIPVSILPGKHTRSGYGAEINCTVEPVLGEELLPKTFRDLVINDLVDLSGLPLTKILERNSPDVLTFLGSLTALSESQLYEIYVAKRVPTELPKPDTNSTVIKSPVIESVPQRTLLQILNNDKDLAKALSNPKVSCTLSSGYGCDLSESIASETKTSLPEKSDDNNTDNQNTVSVDKKGVTNNFDNLAKLIDASAAGNIFRRDKLALSPTMLLDNSVAGSLRDIARITVDLHHSLTDPINNRTNRLEVERPKLLDVQKMLRAELHAAYTFLEQPSACCLWEYAGPDLAHAVQGRRRYIQTLDTQERLLQSFQVYDSNFYSKTIHQGQSNKNTDDKCKDTNGITNNKYTQYDNVQHLDPTNVEYYRYNFFRTLAEQFPQVHDTSTATLAWWILVESSLLNEQLVQDMHTFASHKNAPITDAPWMPYYGPNPPSEARAAFNTYVKCRWPVHVFALDPITQDQNISDEYRRRTEMQIVMALALGGMNGGMNPVRAQSMLRFVRRLERDMATIDVRRTVIGFSHGEDNFGWQFRPRFQSPETPSNAQVFLRDSILGGPSEERLLADEKLEPGIRECTALIVMPSFVPYARIHTRSNWFKLSHKTKKAHFLPPALAQRDPDLLDTIHLSEEITSLRELSAKCLESASQYRDGEAYRLTNTIKQIDAKLPTQTYYFQVPYENTLGGFDMFNTGVTDLAPRIYGFYGAPGVNYVGQANDHLQAAMKVEQAELRLSDAIRTQRLNPNDNTAAAVANARTELAAAQNELAELASLPGTTSIFIVGQNLSVHGTRVIAGGVDVTATMKLLSRQQMQIYIPPTINVFTTNDNAKDPQRVIDVHIATPYGVSNHLLVPVITPPAPPTPTPPDISKQISETAKTEVQKALSLMPE